MSPRLPLLPALVVALLLALLPAAPAGSSPAGPAAAPAAGDNPLAGGTWGVYRGGAEMAWAPYERATGRKRELLGRIANAPKAKWFGDWIPDRDIGARVREYVANAQGGDRDALVQLTVFRMVPWEHEACTRLPTKTEKASYKQWIRGFAEGLGDTRAAVVLQPDGPFALCAPRGSTQLSRLVGYAARTLAALPRTAVYIEVGSAGWNHLDPQLAVTQLVRAGVRRVRGFHLNTTHYETTARQVRFGAQVVEALAARGITGKHFTVDTAQNGRGFTWEYNRTHHGGRFDNAPTCRTRQQRHCVTLGIPPTWRVADERWGLPDDVRRLAAEHVDGYLWSGRPWLHRQAKPFDLQRALAVTRTTPYR
ncbi:glycoside hydrolase family 6 protein [Nocardioides sp. SOB77]|uniref:Glucanase n=2 Tax=Nocardioides oceani TaxID=3058369 RepID=A0ABT8FJH4_9ACTN|nr:glycoside hydrolase family 6 protein [Nocardioides oceani]MDN4174828.1 glycoside hydrolase family 6 protein [Nocardioides oceani]